MRYLLLTIAALGVLGSRALAQELRRLAVFDNVRVSNATGEPHCYGYSLTLWQHRSNVFGLLDVHDGLCGDTPCGVLRDVSFQRGTGRLTFSSWVRSERFDFVGTIRRDDLLGRLNGRRVRLPRDRDAVETGEADRSLPKWCEFWGGVTRCGGVKELCASFAQPR